MIRLAVNGVALLWCLWGCSPIPERPASSSSEEDGVESARSDTIADDAIRGCLEGSVRLAIIRVRDVVEPPSDSPGAQTQIQGEVLSAICGELPDPVSLLRPAGGPTIAGDALLAVAVSPFRSRTGAMALIGYEVIPPGGREAAEEALRERVERARAP